MSENRGKVAKKQGPGEKWGEMVWLKSCPRTRHALGTGFGEAT